MDVMDVTWYLRYIGIVIQIPLERVSDKITFLGNNENFSSLRLYEAVCVYLN